MMARTQKPCPGCGETWLRENLLCDGCTKQLKFARQILESKRTPKDKEYFIMPGAPHYLPYLRHSYIKHSEDHGHDFQKSFCDLLRVIGEVTQCKRSGLEHIVAKTDCSSYYADMVALPVGAAAILSAMYDAANRSIQAGYANGYEDGQRLLVGLADGSTSIDEFNKATIGRDD